MPAVQDGQRSSGRFVLKMQMLFLPIRGIQKDNNTLCLRRYFIMKNLKRAMAHHMEYLGASMASYMEYVDRVRR